MCNFLIAFDALMYALSIGAKNYLLDPLIKALFQSMPLFPCLLLETLPIFCYETNASMPFVIGLERLFNVLFPFRLLFKQLHFKFYQFLTFRVKACKKSVEISLLLCLELVFHYMLSENGPVVRKQNLIYILISLY